MDTETTTVGATARDAHARTVVRHHGAARTATDCVLVDACGRTLTLTPIDARAARRTSVWSSSAPYGQPHHVDRVHDDDGDGASHAA
jgi:hypothetical protein